MRKLQGFQKGINLGGWLSQGKLDKEHLDTFITEKDIEKISTWGVDHVRLPLDFENVETEDCEPIEAGYRYIENCISWCRKYHLNMVLDLHKTHGYIFDDPEYSSGFFYQETLQEQFLTLWDRLSARFAKDADIVMFEMLNEITSFDVADIWNEIAGRCIKVIRRHAPTAKILYGGAGYNALNAIKLLSAPADENIVYNFHCYEPMVFTHQSAWWVNGMPKDFRIDYPGTPEKYREETYKIPGALVGVFAEENNQIKELSPLFFEELFSEAVQVAEERNVPLYCGEYGVIDAAPAKDTARWFADIHAAFEKYGIGRACWTYKELNFGVEGKHYEQILPELIKTF